MNLTLEQLYKLRHALNVAAVHDHLKVTDDLFEIVKREIDYLELLCESPKETNSIFDNFLKNTKLG